MAVCGISLPYLDHDKRAIDFGLEMLIIVRRFNHERRLQLNIRTGIHSGNVLAGIVGRSKFIYDVWGDTVNSSQVLMSACPVGLILVSEEVYRHLADLYEFEPLTGALGSAESNGNVSAKAWCLKSIQQPVKSEVL